MSKRYNEFVHDKEVLLSMNMDLNLLLLFANGIFTCFCGLTVLNYIASKKIEKHLFYYAWALGFVLYGVQIIIRALSFPFFISATFMFLAVILFLGGTWSLTHKRRLLYMFILNYIALSLIGAFYLLNVVLYDTALPLANSFWPLIILVSVLYNRVIFGKSADKFSLGWALLLLSNAILWGSEWIDLFAIFAKFIILWGIMDYDFVIVTERVRKGLNPQLPPINTGVGKEGGLKLIINASPSITTMENWTYRKARENAERDVRTYIFSFQDVISHSALRKMKWIKPEKSLSSFFPAVAKRRKMSSLFSRWV